MGNRAAKRAAAGALGIDMNPLVVAGGISKAPDPLLGHFHPVADSNILAQAVRHIGKCGKGSHAATVAPRRRQGAIKGRANLR